MKKSLEDMIQVAREDVDQGKGGSHMSSNGVEFCVCEFECKSSSGYNYKDRCTREHALLCSKGCDDSCCDTECQKIYGITAKGHCSPDGNGCICEVDC